MVAGSGLVTDGFFFLSRLGKTCWYTDSAFFIIIIAFWIIIDLATFIMMFCAHSVTNNHVALLECWGTTHTETSSGEIQNSTRFQLHVYVQVH